MSVIENDFLTGESMLLQMGPQHPSTHGVLRCVVELDGEVVKNITPVIGYLHRSKEKIAENRTYHQFLPHVDRLDYLAPMSNNIAYIMAVEKLLGIEITPRCKYLRTILAELARISSHLLWLGTSALELGAMTVFMYTFREREKIYDLFEEISGARFTVSYMRAGGVAREIPDGWLNRVLEFTDYFPKKWKDYHDLLTENEIFLQRTVGIGKISGDDAIDLGITGPILRASGIAYDIRKNLPYLAYNDVDWEMVVGTQGDVYERYLVRMKEMLESNKIIRQCCEKMPDGPINIDNNKFIYPPRERIYSTMEDLIHHFLIAQEGYTAPAGEVYFSIEAPKGELGFYIVSDGGQRPYRLRIRPPSFVNLQGLRQMCVGHFLADVVAIIASIDIVLGEVDR